MTKTLTFTKIMIWNLGNLFLNMLDLKRYKTLLYLKTFLNYYLLKHSRLSRKHFLIPKIWCSQIIFISYLLLSCPTPNFGLLSGGQLQQLEVNQGLCINFDMRITGSFVTNRTSWITQPNWAPNEVSTNNTYSYA